MSICGAEYAICCSDVILEYPVAPRSKDSPIEKFTSPLIILVSFPNTVVVLSFTVVSLRLPCTLEPLFPVMSSLLDPRTVSFFSPATVKL